MVGSRWKAGDRKLNLANSLKPERSESNTRRNYVKTRNVCNAHLPAAEDVSEAASGS